MQSIHALQEMSKAADSTKQRLYFMVHYGALKLQIFFFFFPPVCTGEKKQNMKTKHHYSTVLF